MFFFNQLDSLLSLRSFCTTNFVDDKQYVLTEKEWSSLETLLDVLKIPFVATKKMQNEFFTLSDFFGVWLDIGEKLTKISHPMARRILIEMDNRKSALLENELVTSAIYLDPRFQICLDDTQKQEAVKFLIALWQRIKKHSDVIEENAECGESNENSDEMNDSKVSDLEKLLRKIELTKNTATKSIQSHGSEAVLRALQEFGNIKRMPPTESVVSFWEKHQHDEPILYELASVIYSVCATQVPVERSFSGLKYILNDLRTNISQECLENILMIYLNKNKEE